MKRGHVGFVRPAPGPCAKLTKAQAGSSSSISCQAGAEVGCQLPQPADRPAVRRRAGVADDDVDYVEVPFALGCHAGRAP